MSTWPALTLAALGDTFSLRLPAGPDSTRTPEVELGMVVADKTVEVRFEAAPPQTSAVVDAAYQNKYGTLVPLATSQPSRLATLRISPL